MSSLTGSGVYDILGLLGAGAMGEVYRARDTRLGRDVAIKVLSADVGADPDRIARLEREARLLAALNHPCIATIHGLDTVDGKPALVLELVEGPTLAERIARGPLAQAEALAIASQIAEALEAAHAKGIVHRDLKPANVKFTLQGRVKVLDFGLAKIAEPSLAADGATHALTMMTTAAGHPLIVGTPAYMSPEQARGEAVDRTSDTWAFGCVLFEMLTGSKAFPGDTVSDIISNVLRVEPAWETLPPATPLPLRLLLRRCLSKDPRRRLQYVGDARVEIDQLMNDPAATENPSITVAERSRTKGPWIVAAALLLLLGVAAIPAVRYIRSSAPIDPVVRFEFSGATGPAVKISPDGRFVAYTAPAPTGGPALWIRALDSLTPRMIPGTEGAGNPGWSWDSRYVAFIWNAPDTTSGRKLKKVSIAEGSIQTVADEPSPVPPAWGREDVLVFQTVPGILRKVSASGGDAVDVTTLDRSLGERYHLWPNFLPDGRHFLYLAWALGGAGGDRGVLYVGSTNPKEPRIRLGEATSEAFYAKPGFLLFAKGRTLVARPFDADHLRFTGDAVTIVDNVAVSGPGRLGAHVSDTGTLVYRNPVTASATAYSWVGRNGSSQPIACPMGLTGPNNGVRLSPDGTRVAVFSTGAVDIWLCDLEHSQSTRLTNDEYLDRQPVWSPDGESVAYQSFRASGNRESAIYEKASNGLTPDRLLLPAEPDTQAVPLDWSLDNKWIVFSKQMGTLDENDPSANRDLWVLPLTGDRTPRAYAKRPFDEMQAAISPDGRFLAYVTNEVGRAYEVVVQTFPDPSRGTWQISTNGGCCPRWKRDGTELYYVDGNRRLIAVAVKTTPTFEKGAPVTLDVMVNVSAAVLRGSGGSYNYDVTPDGQRFLLSRGPAQRAQNEETGSAPINVMLNWLASLKR